VAISWRPFQLNPDMPPEGMTRDDYVRAKFGGGDRPRQIYQAIAESGREAGIEFDFSRIRRTPNTVLSHRLIYWSAKNQRQDEVVAELFKAYFEQGPDIGDIDTLVVRAGLGPARGASYERRGQVASDVTQGGSASTACRASSSIASTRCRAPSRRRPSSRSSISPSATPPPARRNRRPKPSYVDYHMI
jgi:hypothetical protein